MTPLNTGASAAGERPYLSDRFQWAAPGDQQEDAWLVRFCDKDCGEAIFTGPDAEREAWEHWNRYAPSYNIYVFRLARLSTPATDAGVSSASHSAAGIQYNLDGQPTLDMPAEGWGVPRHPGGPTASLSGQSAEGTEAMREAAERDAFSDIPVGIARCDIARGSVITSDMLKDDGTGSLVRFARAILLPATPAQARAVPEVGAPSERSSHE